jgi:hypothetical protein
VMSFVSTMRGELKKGTQRLFQSSNLLSRHVARIPAHVPCAGMINTNASHVIRMVHCSAI